MQGSYQFFPMAERFADRRNHVLLFLCILWTDENTFLAVNALTFYDPCSVVMDTDCLDRTVANTFVAVLTADFLKL